MNNDSAWQPITPMPMGQAQLKAFLTQGRHIQILGGVLKRDDTSSPTSLEDPVKIGLQPDEKCLLMDYDISLDRWTSSPVRFDPASRHLRLQNNAALVRDAQGWFYWIGGASNQLKSTAQFLRMEPLASGAAPEDFTEIPVELPPMQEEREQHEAVQTPDGRFLVMGGLKIYRKSEAHGNNISIWDANEPLNSVECFDPDASIWKSKAPMILPRFAFAAVVLDDGKVLVCGGVSGNLDSYDGSSRALAEVELYDPKSDSWRQLAPMPRPRLSHAAALAPDGRVWVIGGAEMVRKQTHYANHSFSIQRAVFIYNVKTDRWSLGPGMRVPRRDCAAVCAPDGRLYAIGGSNFGLYKTRYLRGLAVPLRHMGGDILADVEVLDTMKWTEGK